MRAHERRSRGPPHPHEALRPVTSDAIATQWRQSMHSALSAGGKGPRLRDTTQPPAPTIPSTAQHGRHNRRIAGGWWARRVRRLCGGNYEREPGTEWRHGLDARAVLHLTYLHRLGTNRDVHGRVWLRAWGGATSGLRAVCGNGHGSNV
jgi:hypothetical protein